MKKYFNILLVLSVLMAACKKKPTAANFSTSDEVKNKIVKPEDTIV